LLAFEWSRDQVEKWGILIRAEGRMVNGRYSLTERQVDAILDLRLYQLTGLEIDRIEKEYKALLETIKDLLDILAKESRVMTIIKEELRKIKEKHATPRKTEIVPDEGELAIEDLIANEGVIITLTHNGLIKRTAVSAYRAQRRGGKGVIGMSTREGDTPEDHDFIEHLFTASTHGAHAPDPRTRDAHRASAPGRHGIRRAGGDPAREPRRWSLLGCAADAACALDRVHASGARPGRRAHRAVAR
jgi:DNA gyrase subunit A